MGSMLERFYAKTGTKPPKVGPPSPTPEDDEEEEKYKVADPVAMG